MNIGSVMYVIRACDVGTLVCERGWDEAPNAIVFWTMPLLRQAAERQAAEKVDRSPDFGWRALSVCA